MIHRFKEFQYADDLVAFLNKNQQVEVVSITRKDLSQEGFVLFYKVPIVAINTKP